MEAQRKSIFSFLPARFRPMLSGGAGKVERSSRSLPIAEGTALPAIDRWIHDVAGGVESIPDYGFGVPSKRTTLAVKPWM